MKKLVLSFAVLSLVVASCKKENAPESTTETQKESTTDSTATTETTQTTDSATTTSTASVDLPKFSSPEVQKFAEEYTAYTKEAIEISKSGDAAKAQEFATKSQEWATKAQEMTTKMTPEDAKLWGEYYAKMTQEMTAGATK